MGNTLGERIPLVYNQRISRDDLLESELMADFLLQNLEMERDLELSKFKVHLDLGGLVDSLDNQESFISKYTDNSTSNSFEYNQSSGVARCDFRNGQYQITALAEKFNPNLHLFFYLIETNGETKKIIPRDGMHIDLVLSDGTSESITGPINNSGIANLDLRKINISDYAVTLQVSPYKQANI